jgi:hypothetical protein
LAAALDQFKVSPWFGTGAGTHIYWGRYYRRPPLQADPIHAHSDYLELLAEYGILGAAGMAVFLAVHIGYGWRNYRAVLRTDLAEVAEYEPARNDSLALYIGALSAVSSYLAHSAVDFNLHIPGHALIFAFIIGVLASPVYGVAEDRGKAGVFIFRWALPALGLWILVSVFPKLAGEYLAEKARVAVRDFEFDRAIQLGTEALEYQQLNPDSISPLVVPSEEPGWFRRIAKCAWPILKPPSTRISTSRALFRNDPFCLHRLAENTHRCWPVPGSGTAVPDGDRGRPNPGTVSRLLRAYLACRP